MSDERKPFITCNYQPAMSGHFATMYCWTPDTDMGVAGGFYEPEATGMGRYATLDEAEAEGRYWAKQEGVEFIPVDRERAAKAEVTRKLRTEYVKQLRDEGMDLRSAHRMGVEKYPY